MSQKVLTPVNVGDKFSPKFVPESHGKNVYTEKWMKTVFKVVRIESKGRSTFNKHLGKKHYFAVCKVENAEKQEGKSRELWFSRTDLEDLTGHYLSVCGPQGSSSSEKTVWEF